MPITEKLSAILKLENGYITNPTDFIYEHFDDITSTDLISCVRLIHLYNKTILSKQKEKTANLEKLLKKAQPIIETNASSKKIQQPVSIKREYKDLTEIIQVIMETAINDEVEENKKITSLSQEDLLRIKLHFYKLYIQSKKDLKNTILNNPLENISKIQESINLYEYILHYINENEEEIKIEEVIPEEKEVRKIIFAPNNKKSTYFMEDIKEFPDKVEEMKITIDKVLSGYFLKTKDTKPLRNYDKLYEYKNPNGIRVLYVIYGNSIVVCSLFYKDKQKSIKIDDEYEEAIRRFNKSKDYIEYNINTADFYIEQEELKRQIEEFLMKSPTLSKKVGE